MKRDVGHLKIFIENEFETQASLDTLKNLIIRGSFYQKDLENVLKRYAKKYIMCEDCKGIDTIIKRERFNRLFVIKCSNCKAMRHVNKIKKRP